MCAYVGGGGGGVVMMAAACLFSRGEERDELTNHTGSRRRQTISTSIKMHTTLRYSCHCGAAPGSGFYHFKR